jgi:hypothetical protein
MLLRSSSRSRSSRLGRTSSGPAAPPASCEGKHHLVGPDTAQHLLVQIARGPGDHLLHLAPFAVLDDQGGGDAGGDRFADATTTVADIEGPRLPEGLLIGAVHHAGFHGRGHLTQGVDGALVPCRSPAPRPRPRSSSLQTAVPKRPTPITAKLLAVRPLPAPCQRHHWVMGGPSWDGAR